ncbi:Cytochrome P450 81D1 [Morella rubra]|uniref:Cytochrome P450 81D1 n=1 Tax=Morella rubra TaxID=262757 RepID=A0A6A1VSJ1_9ROSI|nr:Cytochrome P450 81D1 [Morella rubra]
MEDILLYSSLSLLVLLVAFKLSIQSRKPPKHLPPSPPSLPILGNLHLVKKPLHRTFHRLSQKYGQIFSLRFGSRLVVIVSSPSLVQECFTKNDIVLANRPPHSLASTSPTTTPLWELPHTGSVTIGYGEDVKDEEEAKQFRVIMKEAFANAGASNLGEHVSLLRWIDHGGLEKRMARLGKKTDAFFQALVDEKKSQKAEGNTMIDHLLSLQASQPEYYTDDIIKGLMLKAKAELDSEIGQEKLMDEPDVSKLHYLQNIISETLRLYPAAPLLVPHMASDDCTIGGYDVPSKTMLLVNAWAIHRDPKLWDDGTSFKPERFENGEGVAHDKLIPFGIGRRACPGAGLAQRTISLALGCLIQCFDWKRVNEVEVDMTEGNGITMPKVVPLEAMCRARPIMNKVLSESMNG